MKIAVMGAGGVGGLYGLRKVWAGIRVCPRSVHCRQGGVGDDC